MSAAPSPACGGLCAIALLALAALCRWIAGRRLAAGARWRDWADALERLAEERA